ncbi:MAG: SgcJ/EcaC family oxidoreductase [Vicinamibacterales bacterium]
MAGLAAGRSHARRPVVLGSPTSDRPRAARPQQRRCSAHVRPLPGGSVHDSIPCRVAGADRSRWSPAPALRRHRRRRRRNHAADAPDDIAAINAARDAFMAAYKAGDADAIGRLYAEDAVSEPNNQPSLEGRDAIVASLKNMFEQVSVAPSLEPDETRTLGNVGLDRGHYTVTVTPKAGAPPTTSQGRYVVIFQKDESGAWKVWRDIDNAMGVPAESAMEPEAAK